VIKLSPAQEKVMNQLRNAEQEKIIEEYPENYSLWWETYLVSNSDEISINGNTATLKSLEKKGLIKIISLGGMCMGDRVKLLE
jgi:hypothetical protein